MVEGILKIEAPYKNLNAAAKFVGEWAQKAQLDERAVYAAQMAVDEACGDIIARGADGDENKGDIHLSCRIDNRTLWIEISDFGVSVEEISDGMGHFLIRQLMDEVQFHRIDHKNIITMSKKGSATE